MKNYLTEKSSMIIGKRGALQISAQQRNTIFLFFKLKNLAVDNFDNQGDTIHQLMQKLHNLKAKQEQDLEQSTQSLR